MIRRFLYRLGAGVLFAAAVWGFIFGMFVVL
jgi:hypothetical protein